MQLAVMCVYEWRPRLAARPSLDQERRAESDRGAAAEFAEGVVRSVFARLTEAPTNWHQSALRDLAPMPPPATFMQPPQSLHAFSDLPGALTGRGFSRYPRSNVFFFALAPEDADAVQRGAVRPTRRRGDGGAAAVRWPWIAWGT